MRDLLSWCFGLVGRVPALCARLVARIAPRIRKRARVAPPRPYSVTVGGKGQGVADVVCGRVCARVAGMSLVVAATSATLSPRLAVVCVATQRPFAREGGASWVCLIQCTVLRVRRAIPSRCVHAQTRITSTRIHIVRLQPQLPSAFPAQRRPKSQFKPFVPQPRLGAAAVTARGRDGSQRSRAQVEVRTAGRQNAAAKDSQWVLDRKALEASKAADVNEVLVLSRVSLPGSAAAPRVPAAAAARRATHNTQLGEQTTYAPGTCT